MPSDRDRVRSSLLDQYERMLPLLEYLNARLKYDTVRWIRTFGTKDDIIFSTRIKSFDRIYEKLVRKAVPLSQSASLKHYILSEEGVLDDTVGIRFVCFDADHVIRLVSHFITTERVTISDCEYYGAPKADAGNALYRFLRANGFRPKVKSGREYEDVSFILRFSHPIDLYSESDAKDVSTAGEKFLQSPSTNEKLDRVQALFQSILNSGASGLLGDIPKFPI